MVRGSYQNGDIPWTQYERRAPRSRNSSLASIVSFASVASIFSIANKFSDFWRPNASKAQRCQFLPVATEEKYVHVPMHAAADHLKTTTTPQIRKASMCPP